MLTEWRGGLEVHFISLGAKILNWTAVYATGTEHRKYRHSSLKSSFAKSNLEFKREIRKEAMNLTAMTGFALAAAVVWFGVLAHAGRPEIFLDPHALILVVGGTVAAALIAFPLRQYRDLFMFLFTGIFFPTKPATARVIAQVLMLSTRPEPSAIDPEIWKTFHPFLIEGYLILAKNDMTHAEFKMILQGRRQRFQERNAWETKILTALAKFPPAFGLLGASSGMIAMMSNLGGGGKEVIGPSMAIALVATFWGIALANLVFLPLADRTLRVNSDDAKLRTIIFSGLILIHQHSRPSVVFEHLLGFLPVSERDDPRFRQALFFAQNKVAPHKKTA